MTVILLIQFFKQVHVRREKQFNVFSDGKCSLLPQTPDAFQAAVISIDPAQLERAYPAPKLGSGTEMF